MVRVSITVRQRSLDLVTLRMDESQRSQTPYIVVLGIAQDGGYPHAGTGPHPAWNDRSLRRYAACLGIVDPESGERWMIEATPDFREQLHALDEIAPPKKRPGLAGIAVTHAHIGHYTGLIHLGREALGTRELPLLAMPRMMHFLRSNGPWEALIRDGNILPIPLHDGVPFPLNDRIRLTPFTVPHRDEYSETVGFRVEGPNRSALFLPDIDRWEDLDRQGVRIEEMIEGVEAAWLDATFYNGQELPGRDMSQIPHPTIEQSMERFAALSEKDRAKIRFVHLNHTNPVIRPGSEEEMEILRRGFLVAREGEIFEL